MQGGSLRKGLWSHASPHWTLTGVAVHSRPVARVWGTRQRSQVTSLQLHRSRVPAGVEPGLSVCLAPQLLQTEERCGGGAQSWGGGREQLYQGLEGFLGEGTLKGGIRGESEG